MPSSQPCGTLRIRAKRLTARQRTENGMRDAVLEILAKEGPLGRQKIYERLVEQGVQVGGRDPVNNVGAHLRSDPRFKRVERDQWALSSAGESERFEDALKSGHGRDELEEEDSVAW